MEKCLKLEQCKSQKEVGVGWGVVGYAGETWILFAAVCSANIFLMALHA